jgi:hypothetical protein
MTYQVAIEVEGQPCQWLSFGDNAQLARDTFANYCLRQMRSNDPVKAVFLLKGGIVVSAETGEGR